MDGEGSPHLAMASRGIGGRFTDLLEVREGEAGHGQELGGIGARDAPVSIWIGEDEPVGVDPLVLLSPRRRRTAQSPSTVSLLASAAADEVRVLPLLDPLALLLLLLNPKTPAASCTADGA